MGAQRYPDFPWILYTAGPYGVDAVCQACGARSGWTGWPGLHQFAAAHREHVSAAPTHYGAGDVIARATGALGITPCTPCEQRRAALNQMLPRVWRR